MAQSVYTTAIVKTVAKKRRFPQATVSEVLKGVTQEIREAVRQGYRVQITNFGSFYPLLRGKTRARNFRTGHIIEVPEQTVARFRPGAAFKRAVRKAHKGGKRKK